MGFLLLDGSPLVNEGEDVAFEIVDVSADKDGLPMNSVTAI